MNAGKPNCVVPIEAVPVSVEATGQELIETSPRHMWWREGRTLLLSH